MEAKEAAWYDEHYRRTEDKWAPWYSFTVPHLRRQLTPQTKLVELGCGQAQLLRYLAREKLLPQENIYAIDQSKTAVDFAKERLPKAHISIGDIYKLEFPDNAFDICLFMETIEHLEEPAPALRQMFRVVAPNGILYVSFPNFLSLPWYPFRLLAEKLNKPHWIVLQPIDKIYTVFHVIKLVERPGFRFEEAIGSNYGPPYFWRLERDWMTRALNAIGLWWFSFHPILVFRKPAES